MIDDDDDDNDDDNDDDGDGDGGGDDDTEQIYIDPSRPFNVCPQCRYLCEKAYMI